MRLRPLRPLIALTVLPMALVGLPVVPAHAATPTITANRAPATLAGSRTGLTSVLDVETDKDGRIYALTPSAVRVFSPSARGNVAAARSITISPPNDEKPARLAVDATGWLYVLSNNPEFGLSSVTVFKPGTTVPAGNYSGTDLGLGVPNDLTGVGSQVAITDVADSDVKFYSLHAGDTTVARRLAPGSTGPSRIDTPSAIDSDAAGRIAVSGRDWAAVFRAGADSTEDPDTAPQQFVQGARTGLGASDNRATTGVGLDARARLVVASAEFEVTEDPDSGTISVVTKDPRVLVYAAKATGDVAPQAVLRGSRTRLGVLSGLEVAPSGALLTNRYDPATGTFAAGIAVHRPLGPYAKPGRPASLKVAGSTASARRTLSWRAAATNADTPVTAYAVRVTCAGRTRLSKTYGAATRSVVVKLGTFKKGTCSARVSARNALGTSAASTRTFSVKR